MGEGVRIESRNWMMDHMLELTLVIAIGWMAYKVVDMLQKQN
jgi:uncharacterized membrane protein YebE (DUF533 family)